MLKKIKNTKRTLEVTSLPDRCSSALGRAQQHRNRALCLTQGGRHVSIIKRWSCGDKRNMQ